MERVAIVGASMTRFGQRDAWVRELLAEAGAAALDDAGVDGDESTITYCRVGERSSIEWFLLHELLGYDDVRNYDGSWTEWGNLVGAPIETGE